MGNTVIQVEQVSKRFRIGTQGASTLREALASGFRLPFRGRDPGPDATLWALRDVSFGVGQGEVIGLVGRNGAGKSTLLKVLARVTRPTSGWAEIRGRVGSLIEVGTGFHHELSGRENVFLSGAVLGMRKAEIEKKFDEIVEFSEVGRFLDTPLKHYSSGMQMRLAFAVAAHLEPEILLVDEVLAVGDINFQRKCLGKMADVARGGRTIIFVSHQINQVRRLCGRTIWIDGGQVRLDGSSGEVLAAYESAMFGAGRAQGIREGSGATAQFLRWEIVSPPSGQPYVLSSDGPVTVNIAVEVARPLRRGEHGLALYNAQRQLMWSRAARGLTLEPGVHVFSHSFPSIPLRPGSYQWLASLWEDKEQLDLWECNPEMVIATEAHQHHMDEWNGILNLASSLKITEGVPIEHPAHP